GTGEPEADSVCSEYLGIISRRGHEEQVVDAVAQALQSREIGGWDELVLPRTKGGGTVRARQSNNTDWRRRRGHPLPSQARYCILGGGVEGIRVCVRADLRERGGQPWNANSGRHCTGPSATPATRARPPTSP